MKRLKEDLMTSLKDIAQRAGVAKSTVSRYLNNGQVSEATKAKIRQVIDETGYQPNTFARTLKSASPNLIGVVVPRFNSGATTSILEGIDQAAYQAGKQLLIVNSNLDQAREKENIKALARQNVGGLVLLASQVDADLQQVINKLSVPLILLGQESDDLSYIAHDDYQAGYLMSQHVKKLGHQKALFIGVPESDHAVGVLRKQGFVDGCKKSGIEVRSVITSFSKKDNYEWTIDNLNQNQEETYIACATDHMAIAVIKAAIERGFVVPDDLSVSGFGGYKEFSYYTPSLTTVAFPYKESGKLAIDYLGELIGKQEECIQKRLSNHIVIGESTQNI